MTCYATLCDFGNPDRINVITVHEGLDTAQRAFAGIARDFGPKGVTGGRCWTAAIKTNGIVLNAGDDLRRGMPTFATIESARILHNPTTGDLLDTSAISR
jgi:hypothetical protein